MVERELTMLMNVTQLIIYMTVTLVWCGYVDIDGLAVVSFGSDTVADPHRTCICFARISRIGLYHI